MYDLIEVNLRNLKHLSNEAGPAGEGKRGHLPLGWPN